MSSAVMIPEGSPINNGHPARPGDPHRAELNGDGPPPALGQPVEGTPTAPVSNDNVPGAETCDRVPAPPAESGEVAVEPSGTPAATDDPAGDESVDEQVAPPGAAGVSGGDGRPTQAGPDSHASRSDGGAVPGTPKVGGPASPAIPAAADQRLDGPADLPDERPGAVENVETKSPADLLGKADATHPSEVGAGPSRDESPAAPPVPSEPGDHTPGEPLPEYPVAAEGTPEGEETTLASGPVEGENSATREPNAGASTAGGLKAKESAAEGADTPNRAARKSLAAKKDAAVRKPAGKAGVEKETRPVDPHRADPAGERPHAPSSNRFDPNKPLTPAPTGEAETAGTAGPAPRSPADDVGRPDGSSESSRTTVGESASKGAVDKQPRDLNDKVKAAMDKANAKRSAAARKAAATRAKNTARKTKAEEAASKAKMVEEAVLAIVREQTKIARAQGDVVPAMVAIGVRLSVLQDAAAKGWTKEARKLGYHPREASRYQKLGEMWGDQIGTIGSEMLEKLPADIKILERICRLPVGQLAGFLESKDESEQAKGEKWSRERFIDEVKAALNEPRKTARPVTADKAFESFKRAAAKTASTLKMVDPEVTAPGDLRARLHEVLDEVLAESRGPEQDNPGGGPSSPRPG